MSIWGTLVSITALPVAVAITVGNVGVDVSIIVLLYQSRNSESFAKLVRKIEN